MRLSRLCDSVLSVLHVSMHAKLQAYGGSYRAKWEGPNKVAQTKHGKASGRCKRRSADSGRVRAREGSKTSHVSVKRLREWRECYVLAERSFIARRLAFRENGKTFRENAEIREHLYAAFASSRNHFFLSLNRIHTVVGLLFAHFILLFYLLYVLCV